MAWTPKKTKYKFNHCPKYEGSVKGNCQLHKGDFGLQASAGAYFSSRSLESTRRVISPLARKYGWKLHWNVFPHWGKTKKPIGVRMGTGKGSIEEWVAVVKSGTIFLEIWIPREVNPLSKQIQETKSEEVRQILKLASDKLPVKCKVVEKNQAD
ncbi:MAG: 50S ribosomal protein L16 [Candidatus Moeniiplasma glomeromycotorum]|nr:50S ribosomal protein L16 [Candidatus Moeniiplasma glomeromycotorum]MCE8162341.1 50S ribosomal protein L16 [Candidatus Moeniiplasma glomeromycotorum]MCE8166265.1 50S ribosomal protein L16 [Candidatus Moeniiplasma glomeromycotorum]MCE8166747.1 50S ribosomal protein L16 [Candidatus Moeniiplasma glomeromycotorum]